MTETGGHLRLGIDLGGTKIEAIALDPVGRELARLRRATPRGSYGAILDALAEIAAATEAAAGGRAPMVGIGIPGSLSPVSGLVRNANSVELNGHPLATDLAVRVGRPVRIENDANCFALAEAKAGAGQGARSVFGVILGTGVGGGIVLDGRVLIGTNRIAGEWGHIPLPAPTADELPGPECWCGRRGCIETWCSGPGLAADHRRATGEALAPEDIAARAMTGDSDARMTLARHRQRLARGLAAVVNLLDPEVIVLGGGLSALPGLVDELADAMRPHVFSDVFATRIRMNRLGASAGVIGAAWLSGEQNQ